MSIFGEYSRYTWGLMKSLSELLERDTSPVDKLGYYGGLTGRYPITKRFTIGTTITREELSRSDALIKYFAEDGLDQVAMGQSERSTTYRWLVTRSK